MTRKADLKEDSILAVDCFAKRRTIPAREIGEGRGVAQLGSAPVLGTGGRQFESGHPDAFQLSAFGNIFDNQSLISLPARSTSNRNAISPTRFPVCNFCKISRLELPHIENAGLRG